MKSFLFPRSGMAAVAASAILALTLGCATMGGGSADNTRVTKRDNTKKGADRKRVG